MLIALLVSIFITEPYKSPEATVSTGDFEAVWLPPGWTGPWVAIPDGEQRGLGR
jgi:hypothetical protein